jgi:acetyltransferase-like isoleucine patch superfamily enzyme
MSTLLDSLKASVRLFQLRRRFPHGVIYPGAQACKTSTMGKHSALFRNAILMDSSLGAHSYVQSGSVIYNSSIGPFCSIAGNVVIGLAAHPTHMVSTSPVFYDNEQPLPRFFTMQREFVDNLPRTLIGPDVWIGQGVMIKAGVQIDAGAVIGAGAIVTKDIAPYEVVAGNPCRTIRKRFTEKICQELLESRWWEFSEEKLSSLTPFVSNVDLFIEKTKNQHK